MNTSDRSMDQKILFRIMLRAYKMGNQKNMDLREMVRQIAFELRPFIEHDMLLPERGDLNQKNSKEVAG